MYIPHFAYPYSLTDGRYGCFHILAIVNNAVLNISVQISCQDPVFNSLDKYPEVELLDHMVIPF